MEKLIDFSLALNMHIFFISKIFMKVFADLHIHSKYSGATSSKMDIENLEKGAREKGINLLGTGDFLHPNWLRELKTNLTEDGSGILKTSSGFNFILTCEVNNVFEHKGRVRKVHNLILAKNFGVVEQIREALGKFGDLDKDGRPTLNLTCAELLEILSGIDKDIEVIPCHVWTPWYGVFGSKSGFDDLKECYQEKTNLIHALETGLSSDPEMNWAVSKLDKYNLVSNSDSHSPSPFRLGREGNVFELKELTYKEILKAIREKNSKRFLFTIEVDPSYGKYHWDGHRKCGVCLSPEEAKKFNNICPVCGKPLTLGVLHRVLDLADRPLGYKPKNAIPFKRILPLQELISVYYKTEPTSKKVLQIYQKLIKHFGSEFSVLLEAEKNKMEKIIDEKLAELIIKNREGKIKIKPGYDGVYGKIVLDGEGDEKRKTPQKGLFEF